MILQFKKTKDLKKGEVSDFYVLPSKFGLFSRAASDRHSEVGRSVAERNEAWGYCSLTQVLFLYIKNQNITIVYLKNS
jgi:hypothetical protein